MKKITLSISLFLIGFCAYAQPTITLLTFESYSFEDKFTTNDGYDGKIGDGFQWGGGLEFGIRETMAIELIYQHLSTDGYIRTPILGSFTETTGNVNIDYIMLGGTRYHPFSDKVSGFATVDAGLGIFTAKSTGNSFEKFCWGPRLGLKINASEKVSLRIHGQLISAVQALGGGLYIGTGGTGAGLTGYSTFWQWNVGGSLNFRLK